MTYLVLAPFRCTTDNLVGFQLRHCRGLVAFAYPDANFLAPQAIITAIVVGLLAALFYWLIVARPKASPVLTGVVIVVLMILTFLSAASLGGVMVYTAPVLIPSYWWMASQSGRVARVVWSLLAGLVALYAWLLLAYMISWNVLVGLVAVVLSVGSSVIVFFAPKGKEPDAWARPPRAREPRTMGS